MHINNDNIYEINSKYVLISRCNIYYNMCQSVYSDHRGDEDPHHPRLACQSVLGQDLGDRGMGGNNVI